MLWGNAHESNFQRPVSLQFIGALDSRERPSNLQTVASAELTEASLLSSSHLPSRRSLHLPSLCTTTNMTATRQEKRRRLDRVLAACDLCKRRKVKCDGDLPCSYCKRKNLSETCTFSGPKPRLAQSTSNTPADNPNIIANNTAPSTPAERNARSPTPRFETQAVTALGSSISPTISRDDHHEDTAVPLEARLLRDAQGKVIFIGDCAPISFLQTVRHLIASEADPDGVLARDSIVEVARQETTGLTGQGVPNVNLNELDSLVAKYFVATSGLVDLFEREHLLGHLKGWVQNGGLHSKEVSSIVYYLVLAIGMQDRDEKKSEAWFTHAKDVLVNNLSASMHVATVQGFTLVAVYMLRGFQPNGAYLYFSLAARTAYAIGLHRTEVNASFGVSVRTMRDRIWKSLRVVDQLISNLLGRPPSTSDVDCTVKYVTTQNNTGIDLLDASVQIFMIIERVVVEVYSRKRISLRIANYVSRQLKGWASTWLPPLTEMVSRADSSTHSREVTVGACQTLCSYYYGIMLLTRPFLIYELYEYLGASVRVPNSNADHQEKERFADAALDAAVALVETLQRVIKSSKMPRRMPLIVAWLFTTSLVLAVGVLGRSGLSFEENCKASIGCLDYFATVDPHARQYSVIVQALLRTTTEHVRKRELHLRSRRKQASSQLFGLLPLEGNRQASPPAPTPAARSDHHPPEPVHNQEAQPSSASFDWTIYDADFFALPWPNENDEGLQEFLQPTRQTVDGSLADIPLFPMYDQMTGQSFVGPVNGVFNAPPPP
ncbi:hypothetical protein Q7P37_007864 [Cladosporium fusiforme]